MATLYVENVRRRGDSITRANIPTESVIRARRKVLAELDKLRAARTPSPGPFPSSEEMLREDRDEFSD